MKVKLLAVGSLQESWLMESLDPFTFSSLVNGGFGEILYKHYVDYFGNPANFTYAIGFSYIVLMMMIMFLLSFFSKYVSLLFVLLVVWGSYPDGKIAAFLAIMWFVTFFLVRYRREDCKARQIVEQFRYKPDIKKAGMPSGVYLCIFLCSVVILAVSCLPVQISQMTQMFCFDFYDYDSNCRPWSGRSL